MKKLMIVLMLAAVMLSGCEYTKDGDAGYTPQDEYVLPTSDSEEAGSVPYVIAKMIESGQVVRDYNELIADAVGAEEAYSIRTNGITVELYRFAEDSERLALIKDLNAYPILDPEGNVVTTYGCAINGNIVMMLPSDQNAKLEDITEINNKLIERFESIEW